MGKASALYVINRVSVIVQNILTTNSQVIARLANCDNVFHDIVYFMSDKTKASTLVRKSSFFAYKNGTYKRGLFRIWCIRFPYANVMTTDVVCENQALVRILMIIHS